ncbi:MAG TPA: hypothetical protein IAA32_06960, partial [Candidatus Butyricicoccus stercorigallinarum]|nr:hypothetical protein [Candidatus Butyricicoccus stercorigallinarum]
APFSSLIIKKPPNNVTKNVRQNRKEQSQKFHYAALLDDKLNITYFGEKINSFSKCTNCEQMTDKI